jgi:alanyl-tRNA synthetase/REP element-mobilizing transposase RayT
MTSAQIRQSFLDFFKSKGHTIVPSASLMPDSPGLLFTNAGMNQFVPIFLNQRAPDVDQWPGADPGKPTRAADTQKCIRAGGKHNDLEDVGLDTYHHTFFEMLGNWSFGDYFKREAIDWAWELVTEVWKFPPSRLYATVYNPDKAKGDPSDFDQEASDFWAAKFSAAGLDPKVHIVHGNKKDNFWMMGETGPCGPCSEIHVDLTPGGDTRGSLVNQGDARCIEIWNLVFIQFNANPDGTFSPLPAKHVDTGMGFERVTGILQNTKNFTDFTSAISNYETDIFRPIFDKLEQLSGKKYGSTLPGEHTRPRVLPDAPPRPASEPSGIVSDTYSRRNLPHFERPWAKYMVTFSTHERRQLAAAERDVVLKSILYAHEHRQYQLYAACVMPDHVHLLFEPQIKEEDKDGQPVFWPLGEILQGIKSASAHNVNQIAGQKGHVWQNESLDRMIRGQQDMEEKFHYICRNPWQGGVVPVTEDYPWLWTGDSGEHTRPRVSPSAPSLMASPKIKDAVDEASTAAREGACAPRQPEQEKTDIAFRVIADHIRTLSFSIADGILPGNNDRNYVLRRILRRAVRYGRTLGFHEPFFYKLVEVLAETMGDVFPELRAKRKHVQQVIRNEEEAFNKTLDTGLSIFENACTNAVFRLVQADRSIKHAIVLSKGGRGEFGNAKGTREIVIDVNANNAKLFADFFAVTPIISGGESFKLYDTYGFPLDLTELMARERGLTVDTAGFEKLMDEQRARARAAQKKEIIAASNLDTSHPTDFVGFDRLAAPATVLAAVHIKDKTAVTLDASPLYAEMGGQVGDTGEIHAGGRIWQIVNTQKTGNTFLHFLAESEAPEPGAAVELRVNAPRRAAIQRHHTVTHLLHWALHEVVSKDAVQKGSYVGPDKLTFDFSSAALTPTQIADVEELVNERILDNAGISWREVAYIEIKGRKEVMQFFGEKYGDLVRVVQIGGRAGGLDGYSMELCGGTHARATGEIGLFRILSESAIAAGIRRIEAVAGLRAYEKAREEAALISTLAGKVNSPVAELEKKFESLLSQQKDLEKQLKAARQKQAAETARDLLKAAQSTPPTQSAKFTPAIIENLGTADGDFLQAVADALKSQFKGVVVLGGSSQGAVSLVATVSPDATVRFQAGKIIQAIAPLVGGKGGGRPDNARGGGKDAAKLPDALKKARELVAGT